MTLQIVDYMFLYSILVFAVLLVRLWIMRQRENIKREFRGVFVIVPMKRGGKM